MPSHMKRLALGLVALTAVPATTARAAPLEIRPGKLGVKSIGNLRPQRTPLVGAAQFIFGRPSSQKADGAACTMRWAPIGLKITFANFGAPGKSTCAPRVGKAQSFRATGDFVTWRGLKIGARRAAVKRRHPSAERHARGYWLKTAKSPFGDGSRYAVVKAVVKKGRVVAFYGWIGAAGE